MWRTILNARAWPGVRRFAGLACALSGVSLLVAIAMLATMGGEYRVVDGVAIVWMFAWFPGLVALAARRLGAPGGPRRVVFVALLAAVGSIVIFCIPGALSGPRLLIGGRTRGTVEQVSASQAGYAEVAPLRVWTDRSEYGVSREFKNGRTTSSYVYVAPIVPEIPWDGEVSLFVCGQRHEVITADPASGSLAGILEPAWGLAASGVRKVGASGQAIGASPRCLTPTRGSYAGMFALRLLIAVVVAMATLVAATWALVRAALGNRRTSTPRH